MKRKSWKQMPCSIARALDVVGEHWSLLVIRDAFMGVKRFEEFHGNLGIARNVLAARLRRLVAKGVLERREYQDNPPRFEYRLTEKGRDLYPVIVTLLAWGDRWACGAKGPPVVLVDRETAAAIEPVLVDGKTGRRLDPRRMAVRPGSGATAQLKKKLLRRAAGERGS